MEKTVAYGSGLVSVSQEVADYLESNRRRQAADERRDRRHLSKSSFEKALSAHKTVNLHSLEDEVFKHLTLEKLRKVFVGLSDNEKRLLLLYFWDEMSMEEVGKVFGVSKMTISKRLKKLYAKMRGSL